MTAGTFVSEVLAITRHGSVRTLAVLAALDREDPGDDGVLGLATDRRGDVYAARVTADPETHGVWQISRDGRRRMRLANSERMVFPNGLAFGRRGDLYVTDSFGGAIWRFPSAGRNWRHAERSAGMRWLEDDSLAPAPDDSLGFPLPGANGIAFFPPDRLYVGNTEKGLIAHVPIRADGTAGVPTVVAAGTALLTLDGVAVDRFGRIYGVVPGAALLGTPPLVRVDPVTGTTAAGVDPFRFDAFDVPLGVTFADGARDRRSVLVTNSDLPGIPPDARRPGVVAVDVGVGGRPSPGGARP